MVTGETIGMVLHTTVDEVKSLVIAVDVVTTEVEVFVLVTACGSVNLSLIAMALEHLLTDVSRGNSGNDAGSRGLECSVHGSNHRGRSRSPGRRLVLGRRHDAGHRLAGSLCKSRVDGRACGRCPRNGVSAILRRSVLYRCVASWSGRRNDVGGGGEDRQYVERELHLDVDLRMYSFSFGKERNDQLGGLESIRYLLAISMEL